MVDMGWWVELWRGWGDWWPRIDWGSAPAWFSSVLTSVSVLLALLIIRRDKTNALRSDADKFVTWIQYSALTHSTDNKTVWTATIHAYNAGSAPIPYAYLLVPTDKNDNPGGSMKEIPPMWDGGKFLFASDDAIKPSESVKVSYDYLHDVDHDLFHVRFADSKGRVWHRNVDGNQYLGKRASARMIEKYRKFQ
jgi:hypothetical protein